MTNPVQEAREDLAFLKALAADEDPLPSDFGTNLLAAGLIYGLMFLLMAAIEAGAVPLSHVWSEWLWAPATALLLLAFLLISVLGPHAVERPSRQLFVATWSGMGITNGAVALALILVRERLQEPLLLLLLLPTISIMLYGGTWIVIGQIRRRRWCTVLGLVCFATGAICAWLTSTSLQWLATGAGTIVCLAVPGLAIMLRARRAREA